MYERQRDFIAHHVEVKTSAKKRKKQNKRVARRYFFTHDGRRVEVCCKFFLSTLDIKEKTVRYTVNRSFKNRTMKDKRGYNTPYNKTSDAALDEIRNHIKLFPTVESHYCRRSSKRQYLACDLNVTKMYELYRDHVTDPQSLKVYRSVFNKEFNLSFHHPKKDRCKSCVAFENLSKQDQLEASDSHMQHLRNKEECRKQKMRDKERAGECDQFQSYTFDLQQVLTTPKGQASTLYYKRKFTSYNFTLYNQSTGDGYCYLWHEIHGKRGSCEIGTCLIKHFEGLPETVTELSLFSDSCGGQNRNRHLTAGLYHAVKTSPHLQVVNHIYLEPGHTQMEVDSMHSAIEHASKNLVITHPDQWETVLAMARRKKPYKVHKLSHGDFVDLKAVSKALLSAQQKDCSGRPVHWLKIRHFRYEKSSSNIKFRYSLDEDFRELRVSGSRRIGRESMKNNLYSGPLGIAPAKKNDLVDLCKTNVIPPAHHGFYLGLPTIDQHEPTSDSEEDNALTEE